MDLGSNATTSFTRKRNVDKTPIRREGRSARCSRPDEVPVLDLDRLQDRDDGDAPVIVAGKQSELLSAMSWGPEALAVIPQNYDEGVAKMQEINTSLTGFVKSPLSSYREKSISNHKPDIKPSQLSPSSPVQLNHTQTNTISTQNRKLEAEGLNDEKKTQTVIEQMMIDQLSRAVISDPEQNSTNSLTASACHKRNLHHTMVKTPNSLTENLLSHKLRFHARILSRCGREACRELVGFYFMCDQTLTVYEYRSFGKNRCSALPFIDRGVYRTRGRPYCLADFSQGANLRFSTDAPHISESLRQHPYLTLRVTHVDEEAKRMLLDQFGERVHWLSEEEVSDRRILLAIQGAVLESLKSHAVQTMSVLGKRLRRLDVRQSGIVSKEKLKECLMEELSLSQQDFETVWKIVGLQGHMLVDYNEVVRAVTGEMSETRKAVFVKVYVKLDPNKTGFISLTDIEKFYCGKHLQMDIGVDFLTCVRNAENVNKFVSFAEFEDYYEGLSIEIPDDQMFINILRSTWNI